MRAIFMARARALAKLFDLCISPASSLVLSSQFVEASLINLTLLAFEFPPLCSTTTEHAASEFPLLAGGQDNGLENNPYSNRTSRLRHRTHTLIAGR
ncbi:TPA: hypothetical protein L5U90_003492 [Pseudomonas aeruginosa]|nr:hypothetical protein [Pseudomonas aeruginosa]